MRKFGAASRTSRVNPHPPHSHACCEPVRSVDEILDTSRWHRSKETAPLTRAEFAAVREEIERLRAEVRRSRRLVSAVRKHERALRHPQAGLGPARRAILAALDATPLTAAP